MTYFNCKQEEKQQPKTTDRPKSADTDSENSLEVTIQILAPILVCL